MESIPLSNKIELLRSYSQFKLNFFSLHFYCFQLLYHTLPFTETDIYMHDCPSCNTLEKHHFYLKLEYFALLTTLEAYRTVLFYTVLKRQLFFNFRGFRIFGEWRGAPKPIFLFHKSFCYGQIRLF